MSACLKEDIQPEITKTCEMPRCDVNCDYDTPIALVEPGFIMPFSSDDARSKDRYSSRSARRDSPSCFIAAPECSSGSARSFSDRQRTQPRRSSCPGNRSSLRSLACKVRDLAWKGLSFGKSTFHHPESSDQAQCRRCKTI